jgi:hypothetical protein
MRALRFLPALTLALTLAPAPAVAQEETVPREMAQLLLAGFPMGGTALPELLTGALPEPMASWIVLPLRARVIGSVVYPHSTRAAMVIPAPARPTVMAMQNHMLGKGGWSPLSMEQQAGLQGTETRESLTLCAPDGGTLTLLPGRRLRDGEQMVEIVHSRDVNLPECGVTEGVHRSHPRDPIPPLRPPPGMEVQRVGSGRGANHAETRAVVSGSISPRDLLHHYAQQLRDQGWVAGAESVGEWSATQGWTHTGADATNWNGVLVIARAPGADRLAVWLRVEHPGGAVR